MSGTVNQYGYVIRPVGYHTILVPYPGYPKIINLIKGMKSTGTGTSSVVDRNTLNLDLDPGFWPNLSPDPDPDPG